MTIHTRGEREIEVANKLRTAAISEIARRDSNEVLKALGLAPSGLDRLLAEKYWDLRQAFRVAECLGIDAGSWLSELAQLREGLHQIVEGDYPAEALNAETWAAEVLANPGCVEWAQTEDEEGKVKR